jgi:3-methyladenine DNA glycosylase AlkD
MRKSQGQKQTSHRPRRCRRFPTRISEPLNPRAPEPLELVAETRREFEKAADPKYRESIQRFFKEPIDFYGVKTPDARRIYSESFNRVKHLPKREILEICEMLHKGPGHDVRAQGGQSLQALGHDPNSPEELGHVPRRARTASKYEEHAMAFSWAGRLVKKLEPADFVTLERWLKLHVSNWAACDTFCGGAVGEFLLRFPQFLPKVRKWALSENRWLRRASAVALIPAAKQEKYLPEAYKTADVLLEDEDDMVQKGYGWLLKEIANKRAQEVFEFVLERKDRMPRTALRYAIEKMPAAWKKRAMAK